MTSNDVLLLREMIRAEPVQSGLFILGPIVVALAQLLNSYVNGLSLAVSIPFALVLLAFSILLVRYQLARFRLGRLEGDALARRSGRGFPRQ